MTRAADVFPSVAAALTHWARPTARPERGRSRSSTAARYALPGVDHARRHRPARDRGRNGQRPLLDDASPAGFEVDADGTRARPGAARPADALGRRRRGLPPRHRRPRRAAAAPRDDRARPLASPRAPRPSSRPEHRRRAADGAGAPINTHLALQLASAISGPIVCPETAGASGSSTRSSTASAAPRSADARRRRTRAARRSSARPCSGTTTRSRARGERVDLHRRCRHRPHAGGLRALLVRARGLAHAAAAPLPARPRRSGARSTRRSPPIPALTQAEQDAIRAVRRGLARAVVQRDRSTDSPRTASCGSSTPARDPHRRGRTARRWAPTAS